MDPRPGERIIGVETEFGCLVDEALFDQPDDAVEALKDFLFFDQKLGVIDMHSRDEVFEPARSGGFLINGARLYIDAVGNHLEYATAETRTLHDLVANDRAGQRLILRAIRDLNLQGSVRVYNNSVDHFGGHTFGCHENYLVQMTEDFFSVKTPYLVPFLVSRQIFAGVGRVGGHLLGDFNTRPSYEQVMENPIDYIWVSNMYGVVPDPSVDFQLSQRADHILKAVASRVRFNRALINPKWEHFYSHNNLQRLHLLFGESNQNEYAYALKVGTTSIVLRLIEEDLVDESVQLANPLRAMRDISRDPTYTWNVRLADGSQIRATDLQRIYLALAQRYRGETEQTDWILTEWEAILDALEKDPLSLGDRLDWVAKRAIVDEYRREEGLSWQDDALHSVDMEYHNIDPEEGLFYAVQEMGETRRFVDDLDIVDAMTDAPKDTRAFGRSALIKKILARKGPSVYAVDWNGVALSRGRYHELADPYETYADLEAD